MEELKQNHKHGQELSKEFIGQIRQTIAENSTEEAISLITPLHAADIAELYDSLNIEEAKFLFFLIDKEKAADVIAELDDDDREKFLNALPSEVIAKQFIEEMDSDDAADVLGEMTEERQEEVLSHIEDYEQAGDIVDLLTYDENTAGGLMAKELVAVNQKLSVSRSLVELRSQAETVDEIYYIYVVDDNQHLVGTLSLKKLLLSSTKETIKELCNTEIISVRTDTTDVEVAKIMKKYDLVALPVVDSIGRLKGRITIDDVVDVIQEEAEKDYQLISGITEDVESSDSVFLLTRARLPWLLIGLFGGIIGAWVIGYFEGDISKYAGLAMFLPLIGAMGGNAGVQSSSIVVQGLANHSITKDSITYRLLKELMVAFMNGASLSVLIFVYNYFMSDSYALTISVSIALFSVIIFASLFGTLVPMLLDRYKIDPALATGPFITTVNDIMGLFMYLTISRFIFNIVILS
ncbi:MAG: magnesium transporter [Bacteroidales bacterium]|nr:magnesium transporter [Bacteroidales bacterium]